MAFGGSTGVSNASTGLVSDAAGNLYGTAGNAPFGIVYEVAAGTHAVSTVATFNYTNGSNPLGYLGIDAAGNVYGSTASGGSQSDGTVFEIPAGTRSLTTLVSFNSTTGTYFPNGGVTVDGAGDIFGTTTSGGAGGVGVIFEIAAGTHKYSNLASFTGSGNGSQPGRSLIVDAAGNLFGTSKAGGTYGDGTVFELPAGASTISTLTTFGPTGGTAPDAALIEDSAGNLFGTTSTGGSGYDGTVFEVAAKTRGLSTLASFGGGNGSTPRGSLYADPAGNLYGLTTTGGTDGDGTIYQITNSGYVVAVPEPATLTAVAGGMLLLATPRRRSRTLATAG